MTTPEQHAEQSSALEASLGVPNPEYCDRYGPLLIPYLAPSWREIRIVQALGQMEITEQTGAIYLLIQRRLPDLSLEEFENLTGPDHFAGWWLATQPPRSGEGGGGGFFDWAGALAALALLQPATSWFDAPLDQIRAALQAHVESESRAWQHQVWGASLSWGTEAPKGLQSRILPDYRRQDGGEVRKAATPYPVHADVAQGLAEAMKVGLLTGPIWTRWPAARDGRPLLHI